MTELTLKQKFDDAVIHSRVDQASLMLIRSYIGMLTRECMSKNEITLQDADMMLHFRKYEEQVVKQIFATLKKKINNGEYISHYDHIFYKSISRKEYDECFVL